MNAETMLEYGSQAAVSQAARAIGARPATQAEILAARRGASTRSRAFTNQGNKGNERELAPIPHGTVYGAKAHYKRGTKPCDGNYPFPGSRGPEGSGAS